MPHYSDLPTAGTFRAELGKKKSFKYSFFSIDDWAKQKGGDIPSVVLDLLDSVTRGGRVKHDVLIQLYILTRKWFKRFGPNNEMYEAFVALSDVVSQKLEAIFGKNGEALREAIKEAHGIGLHWGNWAGELDMRVADEPGVNTEFLDKETLFRLKVAIHAKSKLAYMWNWYTHPGEMQLVLANTNEIPSSEITPGFAGYVLGFGYTLYMGQHKNKEEGLGFTHGTYKQGGHVLCAGEIAIVEGKILAVSNSSGHYKPSKERLINVARYMKMNGIDPCAVVYRLRDAHGDKTYHGRVVVPRDFNVDDSVPTLTANQKFEFYKRIPGYAGGSREKILKWAIDEEERGRVRNMTDNEVIREIVQYD